jgi:hypothetical protein
MSLFDLPSALIPVTEVLERLGIRYCLGGSVASSAYGIARATLDIDLVAELREEHVGPLVESLQRTFYIDAEMVQQAIQHQSSVNVIHLDSMMKIDLFVPKSRLYDLQSFERRQRIPIEGLAGAHEFYLASAEDIILQKLDWYRQSGGVSERQWNDVLGVLKVQASNLDFAYLERWARELGLDELFHSALRDAGISIPE